jgi:uncharacterized membrane protein YphA (DoxX/SURF4 family)
MGNKKQIIIRIVAIVIAVILVQTLYFKFTAAPESVYIFKTVGLEPYGRIGIGVLELIAALLLLVKRTTIYGAILSVGLISGAIFLHLTKLGIEVMNDGGLLFYLALIVFVLSLFIVILKKDEILGILKNSIKR